jgi:transcriptional regulator with XRE-family HTH domain
MTVPAASTRRDANAARATLTERGYTIRAAAAQIGCTRETLSRVLSGRRRSSALLAAVHGLPSRRITSAQMIELLARMEVKA